jgi:dihydrofolate reductase
MRKTVAGMLITLDGVVESPEKWQLRYFDDELGELIDAAASESDAILLGRRTYEEFAAFWPSQGSDEPMADYMNDTPKHIVSTTLKELEWNNSTLVSGDVADTVEALKRQPGKNLQIYGSPTLVRSLLGAGLLDELDLLVHPIVVEAVSGSSRTGRTGRCSGSSTHERSAQASRPSGMRPRGPRRVDE